MKQKENLYPYIIAYGPTKNCIESYYIDVEHHLIKVRHSPRSNYNSITFEKCILIILTNAENICDFQMPNGYTIVQTFDVFFKVHKIFDLNFDKNIINAMHFIEHYLYKMIDKDVSITTRMQDIYNRVVRHVSS